MSTDNHTFLFNLKSPKYEINICIDEKSYYLCNPKFGLQSHPREKHKRQYERPTMKVFKLKHQPQLLVGSSTQQSLENYNWQVVSDE